MKRGSVQSSSCLPCSLGHSVSFVRKLMQVCVVAWCSRLLFFSFQTRYYKSHKEFSSGAEFWWRIRRLHLRPCVALLFRMFNPELSWCWWDFLLLMLFVFCLFCPINLWHSSLKLHDPDCVLSAFVSILSPLPWVCRVCLFCCCPEPPPVPQLLFSSLLL